MCRDFCITKYYSQNNAGAGNKNQKNLPEIARGFYIGSKERSILIPCAHKPGNCPAEAYIRKDGNHSLNTERYGIDCEFRLRHQPQQQKAGYRIEQLDRALPAKIGREPLPDSRRDTKAHKLPVNDLPIWIQ